MTTAPQWTAAGTLIAVTPHRQGKGCTLTIDAGTSDRGKPRLCVCDFWRTPPPIGATVTASGDYSGREWQGKWFAGLNCQDLEADAPAPTDVRPASDQDGTQPDTSPADSIDSEIPF